VTANKLNDEAFLKNILNEIEYAIGHFRPLDYSRVTTHIRHQKIIHQTGLIQDHFFEPTEMTVLPNLDILVLQRPERSCCITVNVQCEAGRFPEGILCGKAKGVNVEEGMLGLSKIRIQK